jgi:glutamate-1-semialdehyde aminotransferase
MKNLIEDQDRFKKSRDFSQKIHKLIPGGAHTYSKGDDQFPELAPRAIVRGVGSRVWDPDGNCYLDCSMGLTSVSLGHAYEPVLEKVRDQLLLGVNFQRPSVLEMEAAERFLALLPQHDMIKFAKNGSTVTSAAVKLARAKTGRPLVAFPGNHPFYSYDDWFIGSTACNKGVPSQISDLSVTFQACSLNSLHELFKKYPGQIACVITEPEKSTCSNCGCQMRPAEFLRAAIDLCHENGALFILDEMVTGLKTHLPGSIAKYGLRPDMATWGKGIANGFSFCALTGVREVMELGGIQQEGEEKVFLISSTHGAETHSLSAVIATLDVFQHEHVVAHNHEIGNLLIQKCQDAIDRSQLGKFVQVLPCSWMPTFIFRDKQALPCTGFKTLAMQEMIRHGVLFQGIFVPCFSHSPQDVQYFSDAFEKMLEIYRQALDSSYQNFLVGKPIRPVFRKYL